MELNLGDAQTVTLVRYFDGKAVDEKRQILQQGFLYCVMSLFIGPQYPETKRSFIKKKCFPFFVDNLIFINSFLIPPQCITYLQSIKFTSFVNLYMIC